MTTKFNKEVLESFKQVFVEYSEVTASQKKLSEDLKNTIERAKTVGELAGNILATISLVETSLTQDEKNKLFLAGTDTNKYPNLLAYLEKEIAGLNHVDLNVVESLGVKENLEMVVVKKSTKKGK